MNAMQEKLFLELRQTKEEIEKSLQNKNSRDWLTVILQEELDDIHNAMTKLEAGQYGQCEISGELIPEDLLRNIPTIKTVEDTLCLAAYCKKPIYSSFS